MRSTGIFGFFGAVLSLGLLWYSAIHYNDTLPLSGEVLTILSFLSLAGALCVNLFTASKASYYAKKCNELRDHMRQQL